MAQGVAGHVLQHDAAHIVVELQRLVGEGRDVDVAAAHDLQPSVVVVEMQGAWRTPGAQQRATHAWHKGAADA